MRRCFTDPHYWKNPALRRSREKAICYVSSKKARKQRSPSPRLSCWSCFSNFHIFLATDIPSKKKVSEVSIYMSESDVDFMFGILKIRPCMKIYDIRPCVCECAHIWARGFLCSCHVSLHEFASRFLILDSWLLQSRSYHRPV